MDLNLNEENVLYLDGNSNRDEVLLKIATAMVKDGYVKDSYPEAIVKREIAFPTALPFEDFGVAIPHTDADHVNVNQIMVGVLKEGVNFTVMGSDSDTVEVKMIFMLAVNDYENYLTFLQKFITVFQEKGVLDQLYNSASPYELVSQFKSLLNKVED